MGWVANTFLRLVELGAKILGWAGFQKVTHVHFWDRLLSPYVRHALMFLIVITDVLGRVVATTVIIIY